MSGDCLCLTLGIECCCVRRGPGGYGYRPHGTPAAARRHYRRGEPLCRDCKRAEREANAGRRQRAEQAAMALQAASQAANRALLAAALPSCNQYHREAA